MEQHEIWNRVAAVLEEAGAVADGSMRSKRLKEDLGLDSLTLVTAIVGLEEAFGITFDDGDLDPESIVTVEDLVTLVEKTL